MDTPQKIGRYEIIEELGRGAMGIVYRAKDPAMDRVVALKTIISVVLAGPQGSEFRDRFYREARTAGAMAHPGIVAVFDVGEHEGMPFLVMEFIAGRTLADAIKNGERLSLDKVCEFGAQIAGALGYAHQRGVVHRDIKPANILLTTGEAYGIERPKITDFGVAKLTEGQTTMTGQMLGTPAFMPPEQFTGNAIDGRSDIFSLGVVLYSLATGEQPFPGESVTAVSYKVVHTEPVPPRRLNPALPARLDVIILKCLAKSPTERYQTGEELARDLNDLRTGDKAAALQSSHLQSTAAGSDPDATLIEGIPLTAGRQPAARPAPGRAVAPAVAPKGKRDLRWVVGAAIAAVMIVIGFAFRGRQAAVELVVPPPSITMSTIPDPAPDETTATNPAAATSPRQASASQPRPASASAATPVPAIAVSAPGGASSTSAEPSSAAAVTAPAPAVLDFDPKALDRRQNARLEIDATRLPPELEFMVEMNGKVYLQKTGSVVYKEEAAMYVPPGVQEFRVTAREGDVEKVSNTVSTEFRANRRNTLTIQLRLQGMSAEAGMPQGLYPNSQLVLTLK